MQSGGLCGSAGRLQCMRAVFPFHARSQQNGNSQSDGPSFPAISWFVVIVAQTNATDTYPVTSCEEAGPGAQLEEERTTTTMW